MNDNITQITLKYLANNVYQEPSQGNGIISQKEIKFYKKRLYSSFKNMIKGEYPNETLKELHLHYIKCMIDYMKIMDKYDILQKEHDISDCILSNTVNNNVNIDTELNTDNINKIIMNIPKKTNTIEDFVEKKIVKINENREIPYPKIKNINIKSPEHRVKGIKKYNNLSSQNSQSSQSSQNSQSSQSIEK
jgi:hypothetical protein